MEDTNPQTPGSSSPAKLDQVQSQVNEVKVILKDNINKVLERGDRLDDLIGKTEDLRESSDSFKRTSTQVARKYWWKNIKFMIVIGVVAVIILILIILAATGKIWILPALLHQLGTQSNQAGWRSPADSFQWALNRSHERVSDHFSSNEQMFYLKIKIFYVNFKKWTVFVTSERLWCDVTLKFRAQNVWNLAEKLPFTLRQSVKCDVTLNVSQRITNPNDFIIFLFFSPFIVYNYMCICTVCLCPTVITYVLYDWWLW